MTKGDFSGRDLAALERRRRSPSSLSRAVPCAFALTLSATAGLSLLYASAPSGPRPADIQIEPSREAARAEASGATPRSASPQVTMPQVTSPQLTMPSSATPPATAISNAAIPTRQAARVALSIIAPDFTSAATPVAFAQLVSLRSNLEPRAALETASLAQPSEADPTGEGPRSPVPDVEPQVVPVLPPVAVQALPLPTPRPALSLPSEAQPRVSTRRLALSTRPPEPEAPEAPRSFFDRMFRPAAPTGPALAYAAPEAGGLGLIDAVRQAAPDRYTAIYDIAAHTVTLPDGRRLEAHSGLGARMDDPRGVAEHMRGATPPAIYELTSREQLFHGVPALRLNPVAGTTYGRAGLLAHTYMLGPRGDSNGCVVFRDFMAFRRAYDSGLVRRLVVVARAR